MSCFYNNYNYNLNNQLSTFGTASRIGGLFAGSNTNVFGNIFGNGFGGYGNYGMFGGFGNYGMFGGFNNCGCGMSPWAQIGYTFGNIAATFLGMWGMSALSNKIQSSLAEKRQPANVDTKESVGKELQEQLKILGIQDKTADELLNNSTIINNVNQYGETITRLKNEIKEYEGSTGKIQQKQTLMNACDTEIKRLQNERDKEGVTPEQKTEFNRQIKEQEDIKAQYKKEKEQLESELTTKKKELEETEKKKEAETTAKGEAKTLLAKYEKLKTAEEDAAKAKLKAEQDAKAAADDKILNEADGKDKKLATKYTNYASRYTFDKDDTEKITGAADKASGFSVDDLQVVLNKYRTKAISKDTAKANFDFIKEKLGNSVQIPATIMRAYNEILCK